MKRLLTLLFCMLPAIDAQTTGDLHGSVKDAVHNAVAGVPVIAQFESTGAERNVRTDDKGEFEFPSVAVGEYTIEVETDGYMRFVQHNLAVTLGHVLDVEVLLQKGESTQILDSAPSMVEQSSTQLGAVVGSEYVVGLPLNARDTYQLLQLQPGVQGLQGYNLFAGAENAGVLAVNGGRARSNNYNVNGGNANDLFVSIPLVQPTPDAIQEFRVMTSTFDAGQGRNAGSVVNVVTKSGSNGFHGDVFEFFRNRSFNTRGFFDTVKPKFNQNQFGGTAGGPIKRDRSYFFVSSEQRSIRQGISSDLVVVPTSAERAGDFSAGSTFNGILSDSFLADALNQRQGCAAAASARGGAAIAQGASWASIFPGNRVPAQCFDGTAAAVLNRYVPLPNDGDNLYQSVPVQSENATQETLRLDHTLDGKNQLSFYYYIDDSSTLAPFAAFSGSGANIPGFGSNYASRFQQYNLSDTSSLNASTVNEIRFTYLRAGQLQYNHPQNSGGVQQSCGTLDAAHCFADPAYPGLGISPDLPAIREGLPHISVQGGFSIGNNSSGELPQVSNTFQLTDNFSKTSGKHQFDAGLDARRQRVDQTLYYNVNGAYTFGGGGPNELGTSDPFADLLLGLPTSYSQGSAQAERIRNTGLYLYAQDRWNLSRNVTLNYGLRWELNTPLADAGRRIQGFRPGQATSVYPCQLSADNPLVAEFGTTDCSPGSAGAAVFPLGLVVPGDRGVSDSLTSTYWKAFAPRIGLAWSPAASSGLAHLLFGGPGKSSVRMAWGMYYNPMEQLVLEQFSAQPPFGGSTALTNTMFNTPYLGQDGTRYMNPFNGILSPKPGQAIDWSQFRPIQLFGNFQPAMRTQYAENFHFTVQRELRRDLLLQVAYVGSQGHRLIATHDINYGQAQPCLDLDRLAGLTGDSSLSCGPFGADASYTVPAKAIPAGFTLHLPYGPVASVTGPNASPITLVGLRKHSSPQCNPLTGAGCPPDGLPIFASIFNIDPIANSNFHSAQVSLEKRALAGLQFQASYTFSKSIDNASSFETLVNPLNYSLSRSLSLFDVRHRIVADYLWALPQSHSAGFPRHLLSGWSVSGIVTLQSGLPVPITSSDDLELMNSAAFVSAGEPDRIKPLQRLNPRTSGGMAFDPGSFLQPAMGVTGNSPRTVCCGPGIANLDFALMKDTILTERARLHFRAEFFNVLNHAQFMNVDGNISDGLPEDGGTFGRVLQARTPRLLQLAMKILF